MHRFIAVVVCSAITGLAAPAAFGPATGSVAFAMDGGEGGEAVFQRSSSDKKKQAKNKKIKNQKAAKKKAVKPKKVKKAKVKKKGKVRNAANAIPNTEKQRVARGPVRDLQEMLENEALKDNLKGLAGSRKRMTKFKKDVDKVFANATSRSKRLEAQKIYDHLAKYRNQRGNKALRKNTKNVLRTMDVLDKLDKAKAARKAFNQAKKTKKIGDDITTGLQYEDARNGFEQARKSLDKAFRALYPDQP